MTETLKLTFVRMNETNYQAQVQVKEWQDWCQVWDQRPDQPKVQLPNAMSLVNVSKYREDDHVHVDIIVQQETAYAQFDVILGP